MWQDLKKDGDETPEIVNYLPSGPIMFYDNPNQIDPLIGEDIVGKKYNKRGDALQPNLDYPHHYWPDLNSILQNANGRNNIFKEFRESNGGSTVPNMMKLQNGANSFYQWSEYFFVPAFDEELFTEVFSLAFTPCGGSSDSSVGNQYLYRPRPNGESRCTGGIYNNAWAQNPGKGKLVWGKNWTDDSTTNKLNALGLACWTHGVDSANKLGPINNPARFTMKVADNQDEDAEADLLNFATAHINAGGGSLFGFNANNIDPRHYLGQYGADPVMPGGRYVVTVRATDRGGSAEGLFYEWDVPIYLPEWRWRSNPHLACGTTDVSGKGFAETLKGGYKWLNGGWSTEIGVSNDFYLATSSSINSAPA